MDRPADPGTPPVRPEQEGAGPVAPDGPPRRQEPSGPPAESAEPAVPSTDAPAERQAATTPTPKGPARRSGTTAGAEPPGEAELLDRAQAALARSPRRALYLTRKHARLYPDGLLAQEREALAIRALLRLGRHEAARRRLQAFERRWPGSAHLASLREMVRGATAPDDVSDDVIEGNRGRP